MSFKDFILVILGGVLVNNYAFEKCLGVCPLLKSDSCEKKALGTGLATAVLMILTAAAAWPVQQALTGAGKAFLAVPAFVAIMLVLAYVLKAVYKKPLGLYFPLIAMNSAVIGLCVTNMTEGAGFGLALLGAVAAGLGYLAALLLFAGVSSRIDEKAVPAAFRGLPISLIAAFIISLAMVAYK